MQGPSEKQNQESLIGKSIVIKGEVAASCPLYVYGSVEGLINAPAHRVTIGEEGKVNADVSAHEIVIRGEVCGNLDGSYRVEIRKNGSLTGNVAADRICVEDGAVLKGSVEVRATNEKEGVDEPDEIAAALDPHEATTTAEPDFDQQTWESTVTPGR